MSSTLIQAGTYLYVRRCICMNHTPMKRACPTGTFPVEQQAFNSTPSLNPHHSVGREAAQCDHGSHAAAERHHRRAAVWVLREPAQDAQPCALRTYRHSPLPFTSAPVSTNSEQRGHHPGLVADAQWVFRRVRSERRGCSAALSEMPNLETFAEDLIQRTSCQGL